MTSGVFPLLIPHLTLTFFAGNSFHPALVELPLCAIHILPCFLLPARLSLWGSPIRVCRTGLLEGSPPLTDPGYKWKRILLPGRTSHHPSSMQLTPEWTWWNLSWWHLCHCSEWPQVNVKKPSFARHVVRWFSQGRTEAKVVVESKVTLRKSPSSPKGPCPPGLLGQERSWKVLCTRVAWSYRALESLPVWY